MPVNELLPWLRPDWDALWAHPGGLPHALLLAGPAGLGKRLYAEALAMRLLCEGAGGREPACGVCDSCRWFAAGNHPDFRCIVPEADADEVEGEESPSRGDKAEKKKSTQILVGQIRALADFVYIGAHRGKGRVIILQPAEAMNAAAANSLLKILEEPPSTIYFILVSDSYRRLLPTIRSRCRMVLLSRPDAAAAAAWLRSTKGGAATLLAVTGGMPLQARAADELGWSRIVPALQAALSDPDQDELTLAGSWEALLKNPESFATEDLLTLLQKWLADLVSRQLADRARFFIDAEATQRRLLGRTNVPALLHCYNQLQQVRPLANHPLNPRLFLEDLAARYLAAFAGRGR